PAGGTARGRAPTCGTVRGRAPGATVRGRASPGRPSRASPAGLRRDAVHAAGRLGRVGRDVRGGYGADRRRGGQSPAADPGPGTDPVHRRAVGGRTSRLPGANRGRRGG